MKKNLAINDLLLQDTELAIKWNDDEQSLAYVLRFFIVARTINI